MKFLERLWDRSCLAGGINRPWLKCSLASVRIGFASPAELSAVTISMGLLPGIYRFIRPRRLGRMGNETNGSALFWSMSPIPTVLDNFELSTSKGAVRSRPRQVNDHCRFDAYGKICLAAIRWKGRPSGAQPWSR